MYIHVCFQNSPLRNFRDFVSMHTLSSAPQLQIVLAIILHVVHRLHKFHQFFNGFIWWILKWNSEIVQNFRGAFNTFVYRLTTSRVNKITFFGNESNLQDVDEMNSGLYSIFIQWQIDRRVSCRQHEILTRCSSASICGSFMWHLLVICIKTGLSASTRVCFGHI